MTPLVKNKTLQVITLVSVVSLFVVECVLLGLYAKEDYSKEIYTSNTTDKDGKVTTTSSSVTVVANILVTIMTGFIIRYLIQDFYFHDKMPDWFVTIFAGTPILLFIAWFLAVICSFAFNCSTGNVISCYTISTPLYIMVLIPVHIFAFLSTALFVAYFLYLCNCHVLVRSKVATVQQIMPKSLRNIIFALLATYIIIQSTLLIMYAKDEVEQHVLIHRYSVDGVSKEQNQYAGIITVVSTCLGIITALIVTRWMIEIYCIDPESPTSIAGGLMFATLFASIYWLVSLVIPFALNCADATPLKCYTWYTPLYISTLIPLHILFLAVAGAGVFGLLWICRCHDFLCKQHQEPSPAVTSV